MDRTPPEEARGFAEATRGALARLGGVEAARRAEADPATRREEIEPVLRQLGLLDLAPLSDTTETIAAALAVREAGAVVCPWPLVQALSVTPDLEGEADAVYVVGSTPHRLEHLDVTAAPLAFDLYGGAWSPEPVGTRLRPMPLDPFGLESTWKPAARAQSTAAVRLGQTLSAFWILGALGAVVELAAQYARERRQFGRPIGNFGATRWRLADMVVARSGLEELASYTLWCLTSGRVSDADVLALRLIALESAQVVLDHGHQVLGAIGLCDEHDVSVIDRHLQAFTRRPTGVHETTKLLADRAQSDGFDGLFPIPPRASSDGNPASGGPTLKVGENPQNARMGER